MDTAPVIRTLQEILESAKAVEVDGGLAPIKTLLNQPAL